MVNCATSQKLPWPTQTLIMSLSCGLPAALCLQALSGHRRVLLLCTGQTRSTGRYCSLARKMEAPGVFILPEKKMLFRRPTTSSCVSLATWGHISMLNHKIITKGNEITAMYLGQSWLISWHNNNRYLNKIGALLPRKKNDPWVGCNSLEKISLIMGVGGNENKSHGAGGGNLHLNPGLDPASSEFRVCHLPSPKMRSFRIQLCD